MRNAFLLIKYSNGDMPKPAGIPKSLLADVNKAKSRLATLEKSHASLVKTKLAAIEKAQASLARELKDSVKSLNEALKKQQETIASLGKLKSAKREKRKPSEYNLFLKDKMSQGMSMVDAVKAWKEKEGGSSSSSTRDTSESWQSPTQQY